MGLEKERNFIYFRTMDKMIDKFSNPRWLYKVIVLIMGGLAVHINFLSSFMGR